MQGPIVVELYRYDVVVRGTMVQGVPHERGQIMGYSKASARRLRFIAVNADADWRAWVDLTYPGKYPSDGRQVKRDLDAFLKRLRRHREGVQYLWVMEFQARGAPHFHVILDREVGRDFVSIAWYEVVGAGDDRHLRAGTKVAAVRNRQAAAQYFAGYLDKVEQKEVPQGFRGVGRWWGASRGLVSMREVELPGAEGGRVRRGLRRWKEKVAGKQVRCLRSRRSVTVFGGADVGRRLVASELARSSV